MAKPYRFPKYVLILLVLMLVLTLLSMTGVVTGLIFEMLRLGISIAALIGLIVSFIQHRRS